jgi:hypothetical protein
VGGGGEVKACGQRCGTTAQTCGKGGIRELGGGGGGGWAGRHTGKRRYWERWGWRLGAGRLWARRAAMRSSHAVSPSKRRAVATYLRRAVKVWHCMRMWC